jgi:hypothetical protein
MNVEHQISSIEYRASRAGFSLTEVLIAIGMLAMGMLFIAGAFPVSIHFTTIATERTIAPTVADEAFAKIQTLWPAIGQRFPDVNIGVNEFAYPSTSSTDFMSKKYWWSYVYGWIDPNTVEFYIFVFKKASPSSQYYARVSDTDPTIGWTYYPSMIYVGVSASPSGRADELMINDLVGGDGFDESSLINDGYTIVDRASGRIYRVLERYPSNLNIIRLDKNWVGTLPSDVLVPATSIDGGRYPCIGVYQKTLRF